MLLALPNHTPHRETRLRRTEKVLYTLVAKPQLMKELSKFRPAHKSTSRPSVENATARQSHHNWVKVA